MSEGKRVLIAEDEKPMARALEMKLNSLGFDAHTVFDGEQALAALKAEKFDVVLLDLMMPKLDGFGVLEALQKEGSKVPVIVSSNLGQPEDMERAKGLGAVDFFVKSDTPISEVVTHVTNVLG